jgi:hypothetical protein
LFCLLCDLLPGTVSWVLLVFHDHDLLCV